MSTYNATTITGPDAPELVNPTGDPANGPFAEQYLAEVERQRGLMADRGFDPDLALFEGGPAMGDMVDQWRRIAVLEVGPVPGIEWLKRHSQRLELDRQVQDDLYRAYERQARDELDHGAYWGEMYFMLTGEEFEERPWDGDGQGGSNVKIASPPDVDDPELVRSFIFMGSAFALGLESGFAEVSFPALQKMLRASDHPIAQSFLPLLRQIGRDEARHLAIHRYAFHHLKGTHPMNTEETFTATCNQARQAFGVPQISDQQFVKHVGRGAPPATDQVLGPDHLRIG
jgi:hypothetical protein